MGSEYASDGSVDINKQPALKQSTGNWRACFYILGVEFSECVAFFGISKNLVTCLTSVLRESNVDAARNVAAWVGCCFLTPLLGAFLTDTYWGRYRTVVNFLVVYTVGMFVLTIAASLPLLLQSSHHRDVHRVVVYLGLYLVAFGNGGIKPCTSSFGADQFDIADPVERVKKGSFFNWFKKLGGSPLTRVSQVVVSAARRWHVQLPDDSSLVHELHNESPSSETYHNIEHTNQFRFFDKAAIILPQSREKCASPLSPWRLCTVTQVEEPKTLLRITPVWASLVIFFAATGQMSSTIIEQGNHIGLFVISPASLSTCNVISVLICVPIYDTVLVPLIWIISSG